MIPILVTGGAGYIGSHTCKALARAGYQPVVLDNLSMGHRWAVKWGPLIEGDLRDGSLVRKTLEEHKIEGVLHFAANALVGESMTNPYRYLYENVAASLSLIEAMKDVGVRRIVFSSTCATYGIPEHVPILESTPQVPVNSYGESKLYIEHSLRWYREIYGFSSVVLRYFNAAGADRECEIGECHDPETHLIPLTIEAVLGQRGPLHIFGTDYPTPDGTPLRDYIHVEDLADAHVKAIDYLRRGGESQILNLGTGRGHSVLDVIASVEHSSNRRVPVVIDQRRAGDPPVLIADAQRASQVLGWSPKYPDLDTIVYTAWEWHCISGKVASVAIR